MVLRQTHAGPMVVLISAALLHPAGSGAIPGEPERVDAQRAHHPGAQKGAPELLLL